MAYVRADLHRQMLNDVRIAISVTQMLLFSATAMDIVTMLHQEPARFIVMALCQVRLVVIMFSAMQKCRSLK